MTRPVMVWLTCSSADFPARQELLRRLAVHRRRGTLGPWAFGFDRGASFTLQGAAELVIVFYGSDSAQPEKITTDWRARPGMEPRHVVIVLLAPAPPTLAPEIDVLPRDRRALSGRADLDDAWASVEADLVAMIRELAGVAEDDAGFPFPPRPAAPAFVVPFPPDTHFVDRDDELAEVHALLSRGEVVGVRAALGQADHGMGARALVRAYAHRHRADYPGGVFWVELAKISKFPHDDDDPLAALAPLLPSSRFPTDRTGADLVLAYLNEHADALVVVEGVTDPPTLDRFRSLACRVLYATSRHHLGTRDAMVEVGPLPRAAALALLGPSAATDPAADSVITMLSSSTLALRLAAAQLATSPAMTVGAYADRLCAAVPAPAEDEVSEDGSTALLRAFRVQWESLDDEDARLCLRVLACLPNGAKATRARLALLTGLVENAFDKAISLALQYHLVEERSTDTLVLHPALARLVASTIEAPEELAGQCALRIHEALSKLERLEREAMKRGMHAVARDVRCAQQWLFEARLYNEPAGQDLNALCEVLERSRGRAEGPPPNLAALLQQIRHADEASHRPIGLGAQAATRLAALGEPHLVVRGSISHRGGRDVGDVALTAAGDVALVALRGGVVIAWGTKRGESIREFTVERSDTILGPAGAIAPDALVFMVVDRNGDRIVLWDLAKGAIQSEIPLGSRHAGPLAITADGRFVARYDGNGSLCVIDTRDAGRTWHEKSISSQETPIRPSRHERVLAISTDGSIVAVVHEDGSLTSWDRTRDRVAYRALPGMDGSAREMRFRSPRDQDARLCLSADGRWAFTTTTLGELVAWELGEGGAPRVLCTIDEEILDVGTTRDGQFVVAVLGRPRDALRRHRSYGQFVQIRDRSDGRILAEIALAESYASSTRCAVSEDASVIAVGGAQPWLIEWVRPGVEKKTAASPLRAALDVATPSEKEDETEVMHASGVMTRAEMLLHPPGRVTEFRPRASRQTNASIAESKAPAPPPFSTSVPDNPAFTGREKELATLHEMLRGANAQQFRADERRTAIVTGPSGIGKTELARAYVRRHGRTYSGGVLWMNAAPGRREALTELARHVRPEGQGGRVLDTEETLRQAFSSRSDWLLVVDGANREERWLDQFLFFLHPSQEGRQHVLLTARERGRSYEPEIHLGPLAEADGISLIVSLAGSRAPEPHARAVIDAAAPIARGLGGVPSLLVLAGTSLAARGEASFVDEIALLAEAMPRVESAAGPLDAAIRELLSSMYQELSPAAWEMARVAVKWASERALSAKRLGRLAGVDEHARDAALDELSRHGILERAGEEWPLRPGLAEWLRPFLGLDAAFREACLAREADALSDFRVLYQEILARGIANVVADLHALSHSGGGASADLDILVSTLEAEQRFLAVPDNPPIPLDPRIGRTYTPLPLDRMLVQLRDAAFELGGDELVERIEVALRELGKPWLRRRTYRTQAAPRLLGRHEATITAVALSKDGSRALSAAEDGSLWSWDVTSDERLAALRGPASPVRNMAMTPDGKIAILASDERALEVWDLERNGLQCLLEGHLEPAHAVALRDDGRVAVSASADGFVCVWDALSGKILRTLPAPSTASLCMSEDGERVVVASPKGNVRVFELASGALVSSIEVPNAVAGLVRTNQGIAVVTRSSDGALQLRDSTSGAVYRELLLPGNASSPAIRAATSADGAFAITMGHDTIARLFDVETGLLVRALAGPIVPATQGTTRALPQHAGRVTAAAASAGGRIVVTGATDNRCLAWHAARGPVPLHDDWISAVAMTPDNRLAVTGSGDRKLVVWDVATGQPLRALRGHEAPIYAVSALPDGTVLSLARDGGLRRWDSSSGETLSIHHGGAAPSDGALSVSPDGRRALTWSREDEVTTLQFWDLSSERPLRMEKRPRWTMGALFLDENRVLVTLPQGKLEIIDFATGSTLRSFEGIFEGGYPLAARLAGRRAFFAGAQALIVLDLEEGKTIHTMPRNPRSRGGGRAFDVTADGRIAVIASNEDPRAVLRTWDVDANEIEAELTLPFHLVSVCALSPDGGTIVLGTQEVIQIERPVVRPRIGLGNPDVTCAELGRVHFVERRGTTPRG